MPFVLQLQSQEPTEPPGEHVIAGPQTRTADPRLHGVWFGSENRRMIET
jgi:hypothetical protein